MKLGPLPGGPLGPSDYTVDPAPAAPVTALAAPVTKRDANYRIIYDEYRDRNRQPCWKAQYRFLWFFWDDIAVQHTIGEDPVIWVDTKEMAVHRVTKRKLDLAEYAAREEHEKAKNAEKKRSKQRIEYL